jgi:cell shape-determining protein MreC
MTNKLKHLASNLNDEEAALIFQLLLSAFETANLQKVQYENEDLPDESSLMINVELNTKNVPADVIEKLLGFLK